MKKNVLNSWNVHQYRLEKDINLALSECRLM